MFQFIYDFFNIKLNLNKDKFHQNEFYIVKYFISMKVNKSFIYCSLYVSYKIKNSNNIKIKKLYISKYSYKQDKWYFTESKDDKMSKSKYFTKILNRYFINPEMFLERIKNG